MDTHPVPKNVLTVEFKLFGALTVKQFMKILGGCIVALIVFALKIHPLIGFPIMIASVAYGVAAAFMPSFEVKLSGIIKALFISPRYVWKKEANTPEPLNDEEIRPTTKSPGHTTSVKQTTDELDASLDRIIGGKLTRAGVPQDPETVQARNLDRVYAELYGSGAPVTPPAAPRLGAQVSTTPANLAAAVNAGPTVPVGGSMQTKIQPVNNQSPRPANMDRLAPVPAKNDMTKEDADHLLALQEQLKGTTDGDQRQQIMAEINETYSNIGMSIRPNLPEVASTGGVYGVVVDSAGEPIVGVVVSMYDSSGSLIASSAGSGVDGKFVLTTSPAPGDYVVKLSGEGRTFPDYKIRIQSGVIPAFKFRSTK